jgi:uncharacterized repeat protein (TIGR01451 family)
MLRTRLTLMLITLTLIELATFSLTAQPTRAGGPWYVATSGDDTNDCLSPSTACVTINEAIIKASSGDTIYVGTGTFTNTIGTEVVLMNKSVTLSGGWEADFTSRTGMTVIDGNGVHRGLYVNSGVEITVEYFVIENGFADWGGGIYNKGTLAINNSDIRNNQGGGIYTEGVLTLDSSSITNNTGKGGIYKFLGTIMVNNSTISGNAGYSCGGVCNDNPGSISINNSTITRNSAYSSSGGGIVNYYPGLMTLQNTILAGNTPSDCQDQLTLAGYNILGNSAGCSYLIKSDTDRVNLDPKLGPLTGSPAYHPLLPASPAINAGNPTGCTDNLGNLLTTDQRGMQRVGWCDIGAYEAGLAINKQVSGTFSPGGQVTYLLQIQNIEQATVLTNVTVTDTLPNELSLVPNSLNFDNGAGQVVGNSIHWNGTISGATQTAITFAAVISDDVKPGRITNTAWGSWRESTVAAEASFDIFAWVYLPIITKPDPATIVDVYPFTDHCADFTIPYHGHDAVRITQCVTSVRIRLDGQMYFDMNWSVQFLTDDFYYIYKYSDANVTVVQSEAKT